MEQIAIHTGPIWHAADLFTQSTGAIECCIVVLAVLITRTIIKGLFR